MPATMGENCHNDRGADREMKGSKKKKKIRRGGGRKRVEGDEM